MLQRLLGLTLLLLLLLLLLLFAAAVTTTGTGVSAAIARASSSHGLPTVITTALDASPSERHAASDLAATLNNISGAARAFRVVAATRQRAITTPQIAVGFGAAARGHSPRRASGRPQGARPRGLRGQNIHWH